MQDVGCRQASILGDQPETGAFLVFGRKKGLRGMSQGGRLQVLITPRYVTLASAFALVLQLQFHVTILAPSVMTPSRYPLMPTAPFAPSQHLLHAVPHPQH